MDSTTHGTTEDGMTLGTTAMQDGMTLGITCILTMQDGTEDGMILIGDTIITTMVRGTALSTSLTMTTDLEYIPAPVTAPDLTECSQATVRSEAAVR